MRQKYIYKTALIVTVFSICERFLGFLYRIILSRTLGSEGLGIYSISLSVFAVFITITSSGIPITVSRLITKSKASRDFGGVDSTITAGIIITLIVSVPLVLALFLGRNFFDFIFADQRCMKVFLIMLPALIFTSIYSVIRGSMWGNKSFMPYSIIEFVEECVMIIIGTLLVIQTTSIYEGAQRASFAIFASYLVSFTMSLIYFFVKGGRLKNPKEHFAPLIKSALPITAMRTGSSLINSLIAIILPARLVAIGLTATEALSEFGIAFGMSIPILFMPSTIIGSIALVLVPELSENYYKKDSEKLKTNIENALKLTATVAAVLIPIFCVLGEDLGAIVYNNVKSGQIIAYSAFLLLPMSVTMITNSILNSLGCEKQTLLYYFFGASAMLACVLILPRWFGIYSLCIGYAVNYLLSCILDLRLINKKSPIKIRYKKHTFIMTLLILPELLFGKLLYNILINYTSAIFTLTSCAIAMLLFNFLVYVALGILNLKQLKKFFTKS